MDVEQNIIDQKYVNKVNKGKKITSWSCTNCNKIISKLSWSKFCPDCGNKFPTFIDLNKSVVEQNKNYQIESKRLHNLFKSDLEEEFGVQNHIKKEKLFIIAYEYGHARGLHDVLDYYSDLVELIK